MLRADRAHARARSRTCRRSSWPPTPIAAFGVGAAARRLGAPGHRRRRASSPPRSAEPFNREPGRPTTTATRRRRRLAPRRREDVGAGGDHRRRHPRAGHDRRTAWPSSSSSRRPSGVTIARTGHDRRTSPTATSSSTAWSSATTPSSAAAGQGPEVVARLVERATVGLCRGTARCHRAGAAGDRRVHQAARPVRPSDRHVPGRRPPVRRRLHRRRGASASRCGRRCTTIESGADATLDVRDGQVLGRRRRPPRRPRRRPPARRHGHRQRVLRSTATSPSPSRSSSRSARRPSRPCASAPHLAAEPV